MEHHFNTEEAAKYGIEAAVILNNLRFWVDKNKANNRHFYDGRYWTYNSVKAFAELFPYMSQGVIRRALEKLESEGLIITGNYNQSSYDRTKWYAIMENPLDETEKSICQNEEPHLSNLTNQFGKNDKPIPYNKPDSKQQIKNTDNADLILEIFNNTMGTKFTGRSWVNNYKHWLKTYTNEQIELAIRAIPNDKFWKDKMSPEILFRQRNTAKEPVDYIGSLLNQQNQIINQAQRLFEKWA